jgi:hypothetical protein
VPGDAQEDRGAQAGHASTNHTMWMPPPCTPGCISEASTSYARAPAGHHQSPQRAAATAAPGATSARREPRPALSQAPVVGLRCRYEPGRMCWFSAGPAFRIAGHCRIVVCPGLWLWSGRGCEA